MEPWDVTTGTVRRSFAAPRSAVSCDVAAGDHAMAPRVPAASPAIPDPRPGVPHAALGRIDSLPEVNTAVRGPRASSGGGSPSRGSTPRRDHWLAPPTQRPKAAP